MHRHDAATEELTAAIVAYAVERVRMDPPPLDRPRSFEELERAVGETVTPDGIGGLEALRRFVEVLAPATISVDHPGFWSFVPAAPTEAAVLFDLVVGASSIYAGSWLEGAGAVFAENQALRWLADLAGLPSAAGGVFVAGGTGGNLSALVAARHRWRSAAAGRATARGIVVTSATAHSSVAQSARVMDVDVVTAAVDERGRMDGAGLAAALDALSPQDLARAFAVVATAGTTNVGVVDDLAGVASIAARNGLWFHVDGAYGAAALCSPSARRLFDGIEHCDSFIVDPHKWLFAPFDCCALLYREPEIARQAHTQHAAYLEVLHDDREPVWNPSDFAHQLTRRARGLPFWFSLATHGTRRYADAVDATLALTAQVVRYVDSADHLELLMRPDLTIVVLRRIGWESEDYRAWSDARLADGVAFAMPTVWHGETVLRCCFVNPMTTIELVAGVLESMR
jgi:glutamate/tyrosine decarboxylase-like PLP-dependent enzyme